MDDEFNDVSGLATGRTRRPLPLRAGTLIFWHQWLATRSETTSDNIYGESRNRGDEGAKSSTMHESCSEPRKPLASLANSLLLLVFVRRRIASARLRLSPLGVSSTL